MNDQAKPKFDGDAFLAAWDAAAAKVLSDEPAAKPKPAVVLVYSGTPKQKRKPLAAVVDDEAKANAVLVERLRVEREKAEAKQEREAAEYRRQRYQAEIDRVWANQLAMQADLRALRDPLGLYGPMSLASPLD